MYNVEGRSTWLEMGIKTNWQNFFCNGCLKIFLGKSWWATL
uniref:Uncharacterized protein n=1 Tax=Rhizophora mucronata TaxID=61149 RepID=A0A2P2PC90_RHIMU